VPAVRPSELRRRRPAPAASRPAKTYDPDILRDFLSVWTRGAEGPDGEQRMFCPLCEDPSTSASPSASINMLTGDWNCLKTEEDGGTVEKLLRRLKSEKGMVLRATPTRKPAPKSRAKSKLPPELENPDVATVDWFGMLRSERFKTRLDYLTTERGLSRKTLDRFQVGYDGQRYTVPIRAGVDGPIHNVKKYRRNGDPKWVSTKGHGSPSMVAFTSVLAENTSPVIYCAGEFDAMLTNQALGGHAVAVTGTGGEGIVPPDLSMLRGREVFVCYDCDKAGRDGAAKLAAALRKVGAVVYILDLTKLGLPFTEGHGADLTDYWMKYGGTPEAIRDELQRVRAEGDPDYDEVLQAMEAGFLELGSPRTDYISSLMSEDDVLALPPLQYSVDTFVPRGMFTSLYGAPGTKKTFIAQDMGNCIRADIPWHGHAVSPGAVLMLEAEGLQQLQTRILAWNEHHNDPPMRPFRVLDEPMDLSTPEGAAALVRTVRGMEAAVGERVELIVVDPAALYMSGSENEDGNLDLARGLNIVAKYLNIGVVLIMHSNASGERARGKDHFRMLAGSHIRVEVTEDGNTGVVQEKVKNTEPRAVVLRPISVGASLAFDTENRMTAAAYASRRASSEWTSKASLKISEARVARQHKVTEAEGWIVDEVERRPGISKTQILSALRGRQVGSDGLDTARLELISKNVLRVEAGPRGAVLHYLAEGSATS
jgi:hypothetical protein